GAVLRELAGEPDERVDRRRLEPRRAREPRAGGGARADPLRRGEPGGPATLDRAAVAAGVDLVRDVDLDVALAARDLAPRGVVVHVVARNRLPAQLVAGRGIERAASDEELERRIGRELDPVRAIDRVDAVGVDHRLDARRARRGEAGDHDL